MLIFAMLLPTYPMICWYLTSLSNVMVTPTVFEESSQASKLFSSRRPSGWGLLSFWMMLLISDIFIWIPDQRHNEGFVRPLPPQGRTHHSKCWKILYQARTNRQADICCIHKDRQTRHTDLLQTQTWELCPKSLWWQGMSPTTSMIGNSKRPNILRPATYQAEEESRRHLPPKNNIFYFSLSKCLGVNNMNDWTCLWWISRSQLVKTMMGQNKTPGAAEPSSWAGL